MLRARGNSNERLRITPKPRRLVTREDGASTAAPEAHAPAATAATETIAALVIRPMLDQRGQLLHAAVGFATFPLPVAEGFAVKKTEFLKLLLIAVLLAVVLALLVAILAFR